MQGRSQKFANGAARQQKNIDLCKFF